MAGIGIAGAFAVGGILAATLADDPPPNGTNVLTFPTIQSFTDLIACVRLDGSRDKDRGSARFVEVDAFVGTGGRTDDGDFFWNKNPVSNLNDSPYACLKNEQEIHFGASGAGAGATGPT